MKVYVNFLSQIDQETRETKNEILHVYVVVVVVPVPYEPKLTTIW